jgi:hypothetical protein
LKDEAVMYTAHYDHLGIRPDMPGDNIYNGAADNATGCGILLELARAFSVAKERSGTVDHFCGSHGRGAGAAGVGVSGQASADSGGKDCAGFELRRREAAGSAGRSRSFRRGADDVLSLGAGDGERISADDSSRCAPEAGHFYRSDHFSLARVGIPSFSINEGMKFKGHDEAWGLAQDKEYVEKHYHQPSDEYHPEMDFTGDAAMARFGFALGWEAASLPSSSAGRRAMSSRRYEPRASSELPSTERRVHAARRVSVVRELTFAGQGAPAACHACFTFARQNSSCGMGTGVFDHSPIWIPSPHHQLIFREVLDGR